MGYALEQATNAGKRRSLSFSAVVVKELPI
jgi:hypothetical protein